MKKLLVWRLNHPARVTLAVGLFVLGGEFLIMVLIESFRTIILKDSFLEKLVFYFLDPIALTAIVSPAIYLMIFRPLSRKAKLAELRHDQDEDEIKRLAFYDTLTGLANRQLLLDRLHQAFAFSARSGREGALMLIDLDNFKDINDTLGHDIGDLLLQQTAQRLESCMREGDTVPVWVVTSSW